MSLNQKKDRKKEKKVGGGEEEKGKKNRRAKKITMIYLITKVLVAMLSFSWLINGIYKENDLH